MGAADGRIRVLTWNVHSCIGTDRRFDPERVKSIIKAIDPDIAALQDVLLVMSNGQVVLKRIPFGLTD